MRFKILVLFIGFSSIAFAQNNQTAVPFLLITPDARSAGMGDVGIASSVDVFSNNHNAAKYAFTSSKNTLGFFYVPWMSSIVKDVFLSGGTYVHKISNRSTYALGFNYFTLGNLQLTDDNGAFLGDERPSDLSIDFQYALQLGPRFSMGVGLKYIRSDLGLNSANSDLQTVNTGAVDVSGFYQSMTTRLGNKSIIYRAGFHVRNFGPNIQTTEGGPSIPIPTTIGLGVGTELFFNPQNSLSLQLEYKQIIGTEEAQLADNTFGFGLEYRFKKAFFLRSGYYGEYDDTFPRHYLTMGAGVSTEKIRFDVSYLFNQSELNNALDNTLRMSLIFAFGDNKS